jgi:TusA-related sulfurtransferase
MDLISEVRAVDTGSVIALLSDAEKSPSEVQEWADESGNEVLDIADEGDHYRIHVKKL